MNRYERETGLPWARPYHARRNPADTPYDGVGERAMARNRPYCGGVHADPLEHKRLILGTHPGRARRGRVQHESPYLRELAYQIRRCLADRGGHALAPVPLP